MSNEKITGELIAPVNGKAVPLSHVPDPAFAEGMLGEGVALEPEDGNFRSPVNGTVVGVTDTFHAYNLLSDDGLEILLHIGIDTVELKGKGFSPQVKEGDRVKKGDLLAVADLALIRKSGYAILTPLVVTNWETGALSKVHGNVRCGKDPVMLYEMSKSRE